MCRYAPKLSASDPDWIYENPDASVLRTLTVRHLLLTMVDDTLCLLLTSRQRSNRDNSNLRCNSDP